MRFQSENAVCKFLQRSVVQRRLDFHRSQVSDAGSFPHPRLTIELMCTGPSDFGAMFTGFFLVGTVVTTGYM